MGESRRVRVWDMPTRLFHWLIVALVAAAYTTSRLNWMQWHGWTGETLLAALIFRLLWGFVGSDTARFSHFLGSPKAATRYLRRWLIREPDHQIGHNPAGGWMILLLLLLLLAEALTGIYVANDVADVGPLTEITPARVANAITWAHAVLWDILLGAIMLHVLAITGYACAKGQNLLAPMITGKKWLPPSMPAPRLVSPVRAIILATLGAAATVVLVYFV
jgi:cytochrome b